MLSKALVAASLALLLGAAGSASATNIYFSFSSDLGDAEATNAVAGTVTGEIVGLTNNATSSATAVYITSYPAGALGTISDPSYTPPINVAAWTSQDTNSFTLVNGVVTAADFHAFETGVGGFDQFWLNYPLGYADGNTNYFDVGNGNSASIWNNNGLAGITFSSGAIPEPVTWGLMLFGLFGVGAALRSRGRLQPTPA